jgi:hypothetical protein
MYCDNEECAEYSPCPLHGSIDTVSQAAHDTEDAPHILKTINMCHKGWVDEIIDHINAGHITEQLLEHTITPDNWKNIEHLKKFLDRFNSSDFHTAEPTLVQDVREHAITVFDAICWQSPFEVITLLIDAFCIQLTSENLMVACMGNGASEAIHMIRRFHVTDLVATVAGCYIAAKMAKNVEVHLAIKDEYKTIITPGKKRLLDQVCATTLAMLKRKRRMVVNEFPSRHLFDDNFAKTFISVYFTCKLLKAVFPKEDTSAITVTLIL